MPTDELVREYLADVPLPSQPGLDMPNLIDSGRRRVRRRRAGRVGLVLLAAVTVAGGAAAPSVIRFGASGEPTGRQPFAVPSASLVSTSPRPDTSPGAVAVGTCAVSPLALPAGHSNVEADVVDPTGRYIGGHAFQGQNFVPIVWTAGVPRVLPIHRTSVQVTAINASGVVVGLATRPDFEDDVFRYQDGKVTFLKPPPGNWHVYPYPAINARGDIVINAEPRGHSGGEGSIAFYWPGGSDTAVVLPIPAEANVFAITDDRVLVGGVYHNGYAEAAYTWDLAGHGTKLSTPAGSSSIAYAIRGDWAVGSVFAGLKVGDGALWNWRTGALSQLPNHEPLYAVNADGWASTGTGVWAGGTVRNLAQPSGDAVYKGVTIADTGLVVGSGRASFDSSVSAPMTWQC